MTGGKADYVVGACYYFKRIDVRIVLVWTDDVRWFCYLGFGGSAVKMS